jgi:hypothetical protein
MPRVFAIARWAWCAKNASRWLPLYAIAKILPSLGLSQLNIAYYASLANFYTIYDLRRLKLGQNNLYLGL